MAAVCNFYLPWCRRVFALVWPCWRTPKCGSSRWNFVAILCTCWDTSTSGLAAAILDLPFPVTSISTGGNRIYSHILTVIIMCFECFWLNNMHLTGGTVMETRTLKITKNCQKLIRTSLFWKLNLRVRMRYLYAVFTMICIWLGIPKSISLKSTPIKMYSPKTWGRGLRTPLRLQRVNFSFFHLCVPENIFPLESFGHHVNKLRYNMYSGLGPPSWIFYIIHHCNLHASSNHLLIPPVLICSTVGARAFRVFWPALWSSLSSDKYVNRQSVSLSRHLKHYSFCHSYGALQSLYFFIVARRFLFCIWSC